MEMSIIPYNYREKSKLECCHWSSPVVDFCIIDVGWALPTFDREYQPCLVGKAHPTIMNFWSR